MKRLSFLFFMLIVITSCSKSSGVVPLGADKYMISRSEKGFDITGSRVKADVLQEANAFCLSKNLKFEIIKATHKDMVPFISDAQAEIEFRCKSD